VARANDTPGRWRCWCEALATSSRQTYLPRGGDQGLLSYLMCLMCIFSTGLDNLVAMNIDGDLFSFAVLSDGVKVQ
jgi:hypothetical protein